ncbi:MAG: hypothetical protein ACXV3F_14605 [Frankiaceae bacterium]
MRAPAPRYRSDVQQHPLIAPEFAGWSLAVLRDEAHRYRDTADGSWSEVEDFWVARTTPSTETIRGAIR